MVTDTGHGPEKFKKRRFARYFLKKKNLLDRIRRLRVLPTRPSVEIREDKIPIISHLE